MSHFLYIFLHKHLVYSKYHNYKKLKTYTEKRFLNYMLNFPNNYVKLNIFLWIYLYSFNLLPMMR